MEIKKLYRKPLPAEAIMWDGKKETYLAIEKWLDKPFYPTVEFTGEGQPLTLYCLKRNLQVDVGEYIIIQYINGDKVMDVYVDTWENIKKVYDEPIKYTPPRYDEDFFEALDILNHDYDY